MGKIGFVSISHKDYMNETVVCFTKKALNQIESFGYKVVACNNLVADTESAQKTGVAFAGSDLDGVVIFFASWVECPTVMAFIREIEHLPICIWGFPMFEQDGALNSTGSYVSYAMFKGVLDRIGYKYIGLLGSIDELKISENLNAFCTAAVCRQKLKRSKIGLVGYTSMGIYTGTFDHVFLRTIIGPEIEHIDSYTVIQMAEKSSSEEKREAAHKFENAAHISHDISSEILDKTAGVYCALKKCIDEKNLDGINVKCQYEFSKEYKCVPCVPLSLLADEGVTASCEGDMLCTVSMMILRYLSQSVTAYGDALHHFDNTVKLSSCGFAPFSMGVKNKKIVNFLPHPGFTGIQPSFVLRPEKVTVLRLIEEKCDYKILYFTGLGLDTDLRQGYMPALDIKLDGDINKLIENYSGQHYAICYGDISARIEALAKIMGIKAIRV
jgi:L-fucose isomerase-like protein